jgi:hypothetical protein
MVGVVVAVSAGMVAVSCMAVVVTCVIAVGVVALPQLESRSRTIMARNTYRL